VCDPTRRGPRGRIGTAVGGEPAPSNLLQYGSARPPLWSPHPGEMVASMAFKSPQTAIKNFSNLQKSVVMPVAVNNLYEFEDFRLDEQKRTLLRRNEPVPLTRKAFETLLVLVQNDGKLVSKDELMKAVWPNSFVEESNLTQTIFLLRKALGETRNKRYIMTVPGLGYRFAASVRQVQPNGPTAADSTVAAEQAKTPPRRRWWIRATAATVVIAVAVVAAGWWPARPRPKSLTVAVLPFENLGRDSATEPFADALTDEVIRSLSLTDGLTVRSRTSSLALKGKRLLAADAGGQLGANYLVEGSVLQAGGQLRVNVELVRARDDVSLWSQRFDRTLTDMFALQDEISRGIVNSLRVKLGPRRSRYETNLEAYELYLRGRQAMESFPTGGRPVAAMAVQYFMQAIRQDANNALPYAGMADALLAVEQNLGKMEQVIRPAGMADALLALDQNLGKATPADALLPHAKAAAARAVELDPLLSESQSALAAIRAREYAWQDAERGFRRAIELNPNNALAHLQLGFLLIVAYGRAEDGVAEVRRATALDPLSPYVNTELGHALLLAGRYHEAAEQLRKAIVLDPTRGRPHNLLGRALYLEGRPAEAVDAFVTSDAAWVPCAEVRAGRRGEAVSRLHEQLRSPKLWRPVAQTYSCLGDEEHALAYLEKMAAEDEPGLPEMLQAPEQVWMRPNPRFPALRKQANLTP
jgi:TolB-like protein/DNA-binding winged helix-turn-helix (wHTH) protein/Flp pilus assembly protein TadD